jgi:hypothetical protein
MALAVALEDVKGNEVKRELEGGALRRTSFIESPANDAPQAFMVEYDANRVASDEGMTFLTLRMRYDHGAQRLPDSKQKLEAVSGRRPWLDPHPI